MRRVFTAIGFALCLIALVFAIAAACAPPAGGNRAVPLEVTELAPKPVDHLGTGMFASFSRPGPSTDLAA